jgi:Mg-chelatase subunit ChlD
VRIDVLVERNGQPVADLVATDFIVEDNGVRQRIKLLPAGETVTVSTVLDVSGSMTAVELNNAGAAVRAVMAALHVRDRHSLYAFAGDVRRIALPEKQDSLSADSLAHALRQTSGPRTSLCDALFAAILQSDVVAGPKMVTVLTDGRNNTGWLSARSVIDAAVRHETVIYPVAVGADSSGHPVDVPGLERSTRGADTGHASPRSPPQRVPFVAGYEDLRTHASQTPSRAPAFAIVRNIVAGVWATG